MIRKFVTYWLPALAWLVFIYWMSTGTFTGSYTNSLIEPILRFFFPSISHSQVDFFHAFARKAAHVAEYFISGLLLLRAFRGTSGNEQIIRWAFVSGLMIILLAASDEYHQSFVSSRRASLVDVGIDALGGALAQCVGVLRAYRRDRNNNQVRG